MSFPDYFSYDLAFKNNLYGQEKELFDSLDIQAQKTIIVLKGAEEYFKVSEFATARLQLNALMMTCVKLGLPFSAPIERALEVDVPDRDRCIREMSDTLTRRFSLLPKNAKNTFFPDSLIISYEQANKLKNSPYQKMLDHEFQSLWQRKEEFIKNGNIDLTFDGHFRQILCKYGQNAPPNLGLTDLQNLIKNHLKKIAIERCLYQELPLALREIVDECLFDTAMVAELVKFFQFPTAGNTDTQGLQFQIPKPPVKKANMDPDWLNEVVSHGSASFIEKLNQKYGSTLFTNKHLDAAISNNNHVGLNTLLKIGLIPDVNSLHVAIHASNLYAVQQLLKNRILPDEETLRLAVGHSDQSHDAAEISKILLKVHTFATEFEKRHQMGLGVEGLRDTHEFLANYSYLKSEWLDLLVSDAPAKVIADLAKAGAPFTDDQLYAAIKSGNTEVFDLLLERQIVPTEKSFRMAIEKNNIPVIMRMLKDGLQLSEDIKALAYSLGNDDLNAILFPDNHDEEEEVADAEVEADALDDDADGWGDVADDF